MNDYRNLKTAYLDNTNRKKIIENYSVTDVITNTKKDGGSLMIDVIPKGDNFEKCQFSIDRAIDSNYGVTRNWDEYYAWKGTPNLGQQNLEKRCAAECKTNQCITYSGSSPPKAFIKESAGYWSITDTNDCNEFKRTSTFIETKADAKTQSGLYIFPSEPVFIFDSTTKTLKLKSPLTLSTTYPPNKTVVYTFRVSDNNFPIELTKCCRNENYEIKGKCVLYTSKGTIGCKENNNTCITQPPTVIQNSYYIMKKDKLLKVSNLDTNAKQIITDSSLTEGIDYFIYNSGIITGEIRFDAKYVPSLDDIKVTIDPPLDSIKAGFFKDLYISNSFYPLISNYGKSNYKFDITFQNPLSVPRKKSIYIIVVDKTTIDFSK